MIPFLKWPGGKRWFVGRHATLLPTVFGRYFEPFLGGGSVFFHLEPDRAVLGDTSTELIVTYRAVKRGRKRLERLLARHQRLHSPEHYYRVRDTVPDNWIERAARTIYLNRTCFNGMYRENLAGEFNVPIGTKTAVLMPADDFAAAARLLRTADLRVSDFEPLIDEAEDGDLVFADPPYITGHNNNGFVKYNDLLFKWDDQVRLAGALARARDRGVKVVATNAAHSGVRDLYQQRGFKLQTLERYSSISGTAENRKHFQELVILSNCPGDRPCRRERPALKRSSKPPAIKGTRSKR